MTAATANTTITRIKVWAKIGSNEAEKVEIGFDSDIDDLKSELFVNNKEEKRQYYGIFGNKKLSSSARIPHGTTAENPILFVKIDENVIESNINNEDVVQVFAPNLHTVPDKELTVNPSITPAAHNINEIELPTAHSTFTTPSMITTPSTVTTDFSTVNVQHLPPHLVKTIHYENGDKYAGEINEKKEPNGKGTMSWKNGRRYEGQWKNGKKYGQGVEYGANGAVNIIGEWKDDALVSSYNDEDDR